MKIIAFVGMPASGKSEASRVARELGIPVVSMGDAVREETRRRGLPPTDENTGGIGTALRREEGMDAIALRSIPKIREQTLREHDRSTVVVDGVRNLAEVERYKKEFGCSFVLVAIRAPFEVRLSRITARGRSDDMSDAEGLRKRDEREKGWGLDLAIGVADETLDNTGSLDEFKEHVRALLL